MSLTLKRKLKFALRFFGAIVLFIFLYAVAVITLSYIPVNAGFVPHDNGGIVIYLRTNGVHTDLVLPIKNDIKDWATLIKTNEPLTDTAFNYAAFVKA